jgi:8-oxo-dGTP pyrophosphatase MutT (NUDIX family)
MTTLCYPFYMSRNIAVTLECFIKKEGKYLMLHRNPEKRIMPDVWMAAGGHLEFAEGLFACARREIMEETNLKIKNIKVKVVGSAFLKDLDEEFFFHLLAADYAGGELKTSNHDGEFAWLTPAEILKLPNLLAELPRVLTHVFSGDDNVISYRAIYDQGNHMTEFNLEEP